MSTTGRPDADSRSPGDIAGQLRDARFVHLVADATGDGVAAVALLAAALDDETPYQLSITALPERSDRATESTCIIGLGRPVVGADITLGTSESTASISAHDIAAEFGDVDGALAIAGAIAGGASYDERLLSLANDYGFERRPGIAVPTADLADGLAHSTLVHTEFSGSAGDARDALGSLGIPEQPDEDARRRIASLVATSVAKADPSTRASTAVERFLRPLSGGPTSTLSGFGDLLDGAARADPWLATRVAFGVADPTELLTPWRDHADRAHATLHDAGTGRYEDLFVLRCGPDAPLETVARLGWAYCSPEPVVLAVAGNQAAARTGPSTSYDVGSVMRDVRGAVGGQADGTAQRARATHSVDETEYLLAFREAL